MVEQACRCAPCNFRELLPKADTPRDERTTPAILQRCHPHDADYSVLRKLLRRAHRDISEQ